MDLPSSGCYIAPADFHLHPCPNYRDPLSLVTDYRLGQRFDVYAGIAWSKVADGIASGYLYTSNINPTIGLRFKF
jgi:predicted porin